MIETFEQILREADKSRFLKPLWDQFSGKSGLIQKDKVTYKALLDFVNQDDPLLKKEFQTKEVDWQKGSDYRKWSAICQAYNKRGEKQKRMKIEKAAYRMKDVVSMAKADGLKVVKQGKKAEDCDFVHLYKLDNDKFTFMVPMNYKAAIFCNSVKCGGEGAKWCLGYIQTDAYWEDYTKDGMLFIIAFNKEAFEQGKEREENTLKYMISLAGSPFKTEAWLQNDKPDDTIRFLKLEEAFGRSPFEMAEVFAEAILPYRNEYSKASHGEFFRNGEATCPWAEDIYNNDMFKPLLKGH